MGADRRKPWAFCELASMEPTSTMCGAQGILVPFCFLYEWETSWPVCALCVYTYIHTCGHVLCRVYVFHFTNERFNTTGRNEFSQSSGCWKLGIKALAGPYFPKGFRGEHFLASSHLLVLPAILQVLWLVDTPLQSLPPLSHGLLPVSSVLLCALPFSYKDTSHWF